MRYGDTWPAGKQSGGPAITARPSRQVAQVERHIGKWARLWLAAHPTCQNHPECQPLAAQTAVGGAS